MRMSRMLQIAAAVLLLSGTVYAQAEKETPTGFYRLEFVTKELDDTKVINTRNYSMIVAENKQDGNSIRSSTRMPIPSGSNPSQYIYSDLGVNIDVHNVREQMGMLTLSVSADISTATAGESNPNSSMPPVIRQYKWNSAVLVPLRKGTQIYSSDDLGSKRKFQLELTATPVK